jgi:hypothetical protein
MKYLSQDLTVSIVCSLILCYVIYYIHKNNKDNENNKLSLKIYVKFVIASSILIYGMLYIKQKMGGNLNIESSNSMFGGAGANAGNYQPNIIVSEPTF